MLRGKFVADRRRLASGAALAVAGLVALAPASAAVIYDSGLAPTAASSGLTFGDHQVGGVHASVAGVGGGGLSNAGDTFDGARTYIYDLGASTDLADGIANRGDAGFAMMIWDMGAAFDSMRLYTHQDHYAGGPITTSFVAQDVMEYSVWGSTDGDNFVLLSDVIGYDISGGGAGLPTYTFAGAEPLIVYRGGSAEFGALNAYTREYVFSSAYQYYGIRSSSISLAASDADPEIDAIAGFNIKDRPVPLPGTALLFGLGLALMKLSRKK